MSTRSYIAKRIDENLYRTIYCHSDGYPSYNGALLVEHYQDEDFVDRLLDLGDLSCLSEKIDPDPSKEHGFDYDKRQPGVTVAYGRDRGEEGTQARELTLEKLDDPNNWTEYVYVYDLDKKWKFFERGESQNGFTDVEEYLQNESPVLAM